LGEEEDRNRVSEDLEEPFSEFERSSQLPCSIAFIESGCNAISCTGVPLEIMKLKHDRARRTCQSFTLSKPF